MKIALGSDHGGFALKEEIKKHLAAKGGYELEDLGAFDEASVDYPDYGAAVARMTRASWFAAPASASASPPIRSGGSARPFAAMSFPRK